MAEYDRITLLIDCKGIADGIAQRMTLCGGDECRHDVVDLRLNFGKRPPVDSTTIRADQHFIAETVATEHAVSKEASKPRQAIVDCMPCFTEVIGDVERGRAIKEQVIVIG